MPSRSAQRSEEIRRQAPSPKLPQLRIVGDHRRIRLTPRVGVTLTVTLFVGLFAVAVSHALLIESQIRLDDLDGQVAEEQSRYEKNRRDVAELESPDRITQEAAAMGMVPPADVTWVTPNRPAATSDSTADNEADTPETSWVETKPYMDSTTDRP